MSQLNKQVKQTQQINILGILQLLSRNNIYIDYIQNRKPCQSQRKPRRKRSKLKNIRNSLSNNRELNKISTHLNSRKQLIHHRIYPEIRNLQKQINQEGPQVPNQVDETMHQRQPPPSNANTTEQPLVQAEGNNELVRLRLSEGPIGSFQFQLIRQLAFKKLVLASQFLFACYFLRLARDCYSLSYIEIKYF
ncbi:Hypothetical_protein [Hexamita inflata]|uniref:Hypothetical_protein n=1 Tax=Hexamita inflata TaxID=28002 RepID=A0AA86UXL0_9EUKA|nr:Hypothetical protein HINF_LOCUS63585 [Hexamita inflata]